MWCIVKLNIFLYKKYKKIFTPLEGGGGGSGGNTTGSGAGGGGGGGGWKVGINCDLGNLMYFSTIKYLYKYRI